MTADPIRQTDDRAQLTGVTYGRAGLEELVPVVRSLSRAEDLPTHARAVDVHLEG